MQSLAKSKRAMARWYNKGAAKVGAVAALSMVAVGQAMAGGGGGPDTSAITGEMDSYKTAAVALVIAFCVVLWAIKASGLLKPRG